MTSIDFDQLAAYLERTRWFGGKGRDFVVTRADVIGEHEVGDTRVRVLIVEVSYRDESGGTELYQVPLSFYREPQERIHHALVATVREHDGAVSVYDALHDRIAMTVWRDAFAAAARGEASPECPVPVFATPVLRDLWQNDENPPLGETDQPSLLTGEQSNSSVRFGETAILKVFRKVEPGVHPDIELHRALGDAGCEAVADLYGWASIEHDGEQLALGMLQHFLRTATDGFDLALSSVRTVFADLENPVQYAGGDFSSEARRLGEAIASVHRALAEAKPTHELGGDGLAQWSSALLHRLDDAVRAVPALHEHADGLRTIFAEVAGLPALQLQRIHGDLHLGQALRTSAGWKIVDFEGEPLKSLDERRQPDSVWRDIAGLLRSFDYAPAVARFSSGAGDDGVGGDLALQRSTEWTRLAGQALITGYLDAIDPQPDVAPVDEVDPAEDADLPRTVRRQLAAYDLVLLRAYLADKAVYEAVYEARNRPTWVGIPLSAIARMTGRA